MKTTFNSLRWLLVILLFAGVTGAMAQTNTGDQTVCIGNQPYRVDVSAVQTATYVWSVTPPVTPLNEWQINPVGTIGNEITIDWNVAGDYVLSVYSTANSCAGPPQSINVHVNPSLPVSVTINTGADPTAICEGILVHFTAVIVNPGTAPTYQWRNHGVDIPGATDVNYIYTGAAPGASITCLVTSNANCVTGSPIESAPIDVTVTPAITLIVSIASDLTTICQNDNITFTASTNGSTPTYQWYNGVTPITGATSNIYVFNGALPGVFDITCQVSVTASCITPPTLTSNTITVTVNEKPVTSSIYHN